MNKFKRLSLSLFVMITSLFFCNQVFAEEKEVYTISIDENGKMTTVRRFGDDYRDDYPKNEDDAYIIDNGRIIYYADEHYMTISKGIVIDKISSKNNLTITTNNDPVYINQIDVAGQLTIENSDINYLSDYTTGVNQFNGHNTLITNSKLSMPDSIISSYGNLFSENSTIKAKELSSVGGALKMTETKFEGLYLSDTGVWSSGTEGSIEWKDPDDYQIDGRNARAFYGILLVDSEINLIGKKPGDISSYRGILIDGTTIKDSSNTDNTLYIGGISCLGASGADITTPHREITIKDSDVSILDTIAASTYVDVAIDNSKIKSDENLSLQGGNLKVNNSTLNLKNFISRTTAEYNASPIAVNGDISISNSKILADSSSSNGDVVAIAYSGTISLDADSMFANEKGDELVKDIDISDITYNYREFNSADKKYTIGKKNSDGTISTNDSDYVAIDKGYTITISIKDGTWEDGTTEDKTIKKIAGSILTEGDLPTGMKSNNGNTKGSWSVKLPVTLSKNLNISYGFEIENPNTVDNIFAFILLGLISLSTLVGIVFYRKRMN